MQDFLEELKGQQVDSNPDPLKLNFSEIVTMLLTTVSEFSTPRAVTSIHSLIEIFTLGVDRHGDPS